MISADFDSAGRAGAAFVEEGCSTSEGDRAGVAVSVIMGFALAVANSAAARILRAITLAHAALARDQRNLLARYLIEHRPLLFGNGFMIPFTDVDERKRRDDRLRVLDHREHF